MKNPNFKTATINHQKKDAYEWIAQELKSYFSYPRKYQDTAGNKEKRLSIKELAIWYMQSLIEKGFSLQKVTSEIKEIFNVMSSKFRVDLQEDVEWFGYDCEKCTLEDFFAGIYQAIYRELVDNLRLCSDSSWLGNFISLNLDEKIAEEKKLR